MRNIKRLWMIALAIFFCLGLPNNSYGYETADYFVYPIDCYIENDGCRGWGEYYDGEKHLADDFCCEVGTIVKAVANGVVKFTHYDPDDNDDWGWYGLIVVEHTLPSGSKICSVYGHTKALPNITVGMEVTVGMEIGEIIEYPPNANHIHFSIYNGEYGDNWIIYPGWCISYVAPDNFPGNYLNPIQFIKDNYLPLTATNLIGCTSPTGPYPAGPWTIYSGDDFHTESDIVNTGTSTIVIDSLFWTINNNDSCTVFQNLGEINGPISIDSGSSYHCASGSYMFPSNEAGNYQVVLHAVIDNHSYEIIREDLEVQNLVAGIVDPPTDPAPNPERPEENCEETLTNIDPTIWGTVFRCDHYNRPCPGNNLIFTISASYGGSLNHSYKWDFGDCSPNVIGQQVNHSYSSVGIYRVWCIITDNETHKKNKMGIDVWVYDSAASSSCTITVNQSTGGTITPGTTSVNSGTNKTFTITPDLWYQVVNINADENLYPAGNEFTFYGIGQNHSLTAIFALCSNLPDISLSRDEIDFGNENYGNTTAPQTIVITNNGTADLAVVNK